MRQRRRHAAAGFVLPLASATAMTLLLSSLALQSLGLAARQRTAVGMRLQEAEDRLSSAAQLLVARIKLRHACLLSLPLEQWPGAPCVDAASLDQLRRGEVLGMRWQLLSWRPEPAAATATGQPQQLLLLDLALDSLGREPGLRSRFALRLLGVPWQVQELRPLGLHGEPT